MAKSCVLYDRVCVDCGECSVCDFDSSKRCNNCGKCIDEVQEFRTLNVAEFAKSHYKKRYKMKTEIKS